MIVIDRNNVFCNNNPPSVVNFNVHTTGRVERIACKNAGISRRPVRSIV